MEIGLTDAPLSSLTGELLGVRPHIEAMVQFICECNTPMTIAIQGDWGTGKTSVMKIISEQLKHKPVECVWFNTWQFSQFDMQADVPVALLMELLRNIDVEESQARKIVTALVKRGVIVASAMFAGKEGADAAKDAMNINPLNVYAQIRNLREQLEIDIEKKLEKSKKDRLVIFVDDLDRMNPGRAVELLEVIKNFMDLPHCVFVLAVDYGVVSRGTRQKYGEDMDEAKGRSFFDKIIQLPYNLPVSQYTIVKYLKNIFNIPESDLRLYKELAVNSVGTNPRSLKRLANVMSLLKLLAAKNNSESLERPEFQRVLFAILCLQMAYGPVYSQIMTAEPEEVARFIDKAPVEREEMFRAALANCMSKKEAGDERKKEEIEERFSRFSDALLAALPRQEGAEDQVDKDLFVDLLAMSGLTSAGSLSLLNTNSVKNTFDSTLIMQLPALCQDAGYKFREFWDLLGTEPVFRIKDTKIVAPLTFGDSVALEFHLSADGIDTICYSNQRVTIKKPFYESLKAMAPKLLEKSEYFASRGSFLTFPFVSWIKPVDDSGADASMARYNQLKKLVMDAWFGQLLPAMLPVWKENNSMLEKLQNFVLRIADALSDIFLLREGWEIQAGKKGIGFIENNDLLSIRKTTWPPRYKIILSRDGGGHFMAFYHIWDENHKDNPVTASILQKWLEQASLPEEIQTGRNAQFAFWAYLPKSFRQSWITGTYFTNNFRYGLDEEKERQILETMENYGRRFLAIEKDLDDWVAKNSAGA